MTPPFRYFEDFPVGETIALGTRVMERDEMVAFAREFDPQPMHLDEAAAETTMLGGLAASGWHTAAVMMRMFCDSFVLASSSLGSPGVESLKWLRPVRPGDTLTGVAEVIEARVSKSRPEMGLVRIEVILRNQAGEPVLTMRSPMMFARRPATG